MSETFDEKKIVVQKVLAREIVKNLLDSGLSEVQKVYIIKLLSYELEDSTLMKKLTSVISESNLDEKNLKPLTKIYT